MAAGTGDTVLLYQTLIHCDEHDLSLVSPSLIYPCADQGIDACKYSSNGPIKETDNH